MPDLSLTLGGSPATISFADLGDGPPLVLVHGFPLDGRIWDDVVPILVGRSIRVIVPDLPGFGRSTIADASKLTMQTLADGIVAVLDALSIDRAVIAGLSMGGYALQQLLRSAPQRVAGASFVDTRANADDEKGKAARNTMLTTIAERGTPGVVEAMLPKMLAERALRDAPVTVVRLREIMIDQPPATLAAATVAMRDRLDFTGNLNTPPCPLQVIVGDEDAIAPPAVARAMAAAAPGARLDLIEGAGHMAPLEQPARVAAALAEFVMHASSKGNG